MNSDYRPWPAEWYVPPVLDSWLTSLRQLDTVQPLPAGYSRHTLYQGQRVKAQKDQDGVLRLYIPHGFSFGAEPREWPKLYKESPIGVTGFIGALCGAVFFGPWGALIGGIAGVAVDMARKDPSGRT